MNPENHEYFRNLILERKQSSLANLGTIEASSLRTTARDQSGDLSAYSFHMADQGSDTMDRERAFSLASREGRYLHHLDEALHRIDTGSYGVCRTCGAEIGRARLESVPHTTQCISCKSLEEKKKRGFR
jgi:DnaK suppressor protein